MITDIVKREAFARVLPFAVFMAFIGLEEIMRFCMARDFVDFSEQSLYYLYPFKAISVGLLLVLLRDRYWEIRTKELKDLGMLLVSLGVGVVVFLLWVRMDWSFAIQGAPKGFNPEMFPEGSARSLMIITRLMGAVLVVPVMEELFWRSFLIRYVIEPRFDKVAIGRFTWPSFLITTVLFGLEHHFFLAGVMAGVAYNLLLYYSKSITHCIVAHAVTNLALGLYVLHTGKWYFW